MERALPKVGWHLSMLRPLATFLWQVPLRLIISLTQGSAPSTRESENERIRKQNEWIKEENEKRMKENDRRLQEWKQQQEQSKKKASNCDKCGTPLEGETVELEAINKEYHKR
jgi:hypothetical protein